MKEMQKDETVRERLPPAARLPRPSPKASAPEPSETAGTSSSGPGPSEPASSIPGPKPGPSEPASSSSAPKPGTAEPATSRSGPGSVVAQRKPRKSVTFSQAFPNEAGAWPPPEAPAATPIPVTEYMWPAMLAYILLFTSPTLEARAPRPWLFAALPLLAIALSALQPVLLALNHGHGVRACAALLLSPKAWLAQLAAMEPRRSKLCVVYALCVVPALARAVWVWPCQKALLALVAAACAMRRYAVLARGAPPPAPAPAPGRGRMDIRGPIPMVCPVAGPARPHAD